MFASQSQCYIIILSNRTLQAARCSKYQHNLFQFDLIFELVPSDWGLAIHISVALLYFISKLAQFPWIPFECNETTQIRCVVLLVFSVDARIKLGHLDLSLLNFNMKVGKIGHRSEQNIGPVITQQRINFDWRYTIASQASQTFWRVIRSKRVWISLLRTRNSYWCWVGEYSLPLFASYWYFTWVPDASCHDGQKDSFTSEWNTVLFPFMQAI